MSPEKELYNFNTELFEKVNKLHSGNIYRDGETGKIVVINYEGIRELARGLLENKKLGRLYELGLTKTLEKYIKTNPRCFEDLTIINDIDYYNNLAKHIQKDPSIIGRACNYLLDIAKKYKKGAIIAGSTAAAGLIVTPVLEKYLFDNNDAFVQAADNGHENVIGVYANNIDWELNKSAILRASSEAGVEIDRITNTAQFPYYDKILVLGGHKAYTDKYMPENIAGEFLTDEEKGQLLDSGETIIKYVFRPFGKHQNLFIYAGSEREDTEKIPNDDYESDGLSNIMEFMIGTKYNNWDTDNDKLNDYFEWKFREEKGGLYDPFVKNDRYLLFFRPYEKFPSLLSSQERYYYREQEFPKNNVETVFQEDATYSRFKREISKLASKADKNDFIFIYLHGHGSESGKFKFWDQLVPFTDIDRILDKITNAKVVTIEVSSCHSAKNIDYLKDGPCPRIVTNSMAIQASSSWIYSNDKRKFDENNDGYISIKEFINFEKKYKSDISKLRLIDSSNLADDVYLGSYNFDEYSNKFFFD